MEELAIFIPTWHRPDRLQKVADNIKETTRTPYKLYWGCEPDDRASIAAAKRTKHQVVMNTGEQGYSDTAQCMYERTAEPFMFVGNDDFHFSDGWDLLPITHLKNNPQTMVVGLEDGLQNNYWTIHMIRRSYIKEQSGVVDMPNRLFYPYHHNFQDTEFTQTAIKRGVWERVPGPCITHLRLDKDETYTKNDVMFSTDHGVYLSRIHLFS